MTGIAAGVSAPAAALRNAAVRYIKLGLPVLPLNGKIPLAGSTERLAPPRRVVADGHVLDPPALVAALWSGRMLGHSQRAFAQNADARFLVVNGRQTAYEGTGTPDVQDVLNATSLAPWMRALLRQYRITLVMTDRRKISDDNIMGFFWDVGPAALTRAATQSKFDAPDVDRLYDGGNIAIYGVRGLW
jgi:hypothetical protein